MIRKKFSPFKSKIWLSSLTMHGEELKYMAEAYETNWMSTIGANINEVEHLTAEKTGCKYAIILTVMSGFAQLEREKIHRRQEEGIAAAKEKGVKFGNLAKW